MANTSEWQFMLFRNMLCRCHSKNRHILQPLACVDGNGDGFLFGILLVLNMYRLMASILVTASLCS